MSKKPRYIDLNNPNDWDQVRHILMSKHEDVNDDLYDDLGSSDEDCAKVIEKGNNVADTSEKMKEDIADGSPDNDFVNDLEEVRKFLVSSYSDEANDDTRPNITSLTSDEDYVPDDDPDADSGSGEDFGDSNADRRAADYFVGRDKITRWSKNVPVKPIKSEVQDPPVPEVKESARGVISEYDAWNCLFTDEMLNMILTHTNNYVASVKEKYARSRSAKDVTMSELKAFIGLLYLAGILKSNRQSLNDLWSVEGMGVERFRLSMSMNRFKFLQRCLMFDEIASHDDRTKVDKLADVREILSLFVDNCKKCYSLGQNVTIGEKLEAFRGQCSFKQYVPSKTLRYGIKIVTLVDSKTLYTSNLEIHTGKRPDGPFALSNKPRDVVKRMTSHIYNTGRTITAGSCFTDFQLIQDLKKENISYIGAVRNKKRQIPSAFVSTRNRDENSSMFAFTDDVTLVSYIPKKGKNVILMSSIKEDDLIEKDASDTKTPAIITLYNKTKSAVDLVEEMCATYNTARNTQRWPMVIFYAMLNIAGINSQVIYMGNQNAISSRRDFLKNLVINLTSENVTRRAEESRGLPRLLQQDLEKFKTSAVPEVQDVGSSDTKKRKLCAPCKHVSKRRNTKYVCQRCEKVYLCLEHAIVVCAGCFGSTEEKD